MTIEAGETAARPILLREILERTARDYPLNPAVISGSQRLDYRELDARVDRLAQDLVSSGVTNNSTVAVCVLRSPEAVLAIHAAARTGAVVAPLDVKDPPARVAAMIVGGSITHLVIERSALQDLRSHLPATERQTNTAEESLVIVGIAEADGDSPVGQSGGYLLFTSGSTGAPKGVLLHQSAVTHFTRWAMRTLALTPDDRVAAQAALTFDLSTFDIFSTAEAGAAMVLMPDWLKPFPLDTTEWLAAQRISVIYAVPTLLRGISEHASTLPDLRAIAFAGEPYPARALAGLVEAFPKARIFNFYGPTETNVCTYADISAHWCPGTPVSIGSSIDGVVTGLVNADLELDDTEGELVVAGPTLLEGYLIDGALVDPTVPVQFSDGVERRAYRTGDRAVRGEDGWFYLRGRSDAQIKRRGYRIDLAGIEAVVGALPMIRACGAVAVEPDNEMILFVETDGDPASGDAIADALRAEFPVTHRPDHLVHLEKLPRNSRGKIDYTRLRSIATAPRQ